MRARRACTGSTRERGRPYSCEMERRIRSTSRTKLRIVAVEHLPQPLKLNPSRSGKTWRSVSAAVAKAGKVTREQASQQAPSSQRRPSLSGRLTCWLLRLCGS